jgi:ABC-type transporter Mla subunit MlaD
MDQLKDIDQELAVVTAATIRASEQYAAAKEEVARVERLLDAKDAQLDEAFLRLRRLLDRQAQLKSQQIQLLKSVP